MVREVGKDSRSASGGFKRGEDIGMFPSRGRGSVRPAMGPPPHPGGSAIRRHAPSRRLAQGKHRKRCSDRATGAKSQACAPPAWMIRERATRPWDCAGWSQGGRCGAFAHMIEWRAFKNLIPAIGVYCQEKVSRISQSRLLRCVMRPFTLSPLVTSFGSKCATACSAPLGCAGGQLLRTFSRRLGENSPTNA